MCARSCKHICKITQKFPSEHCPRISARSHGDMRKITHGSRRGDCTRIFRRFRHRSNKDFLAKMSPGSRQELRTGNCRGSRKDPAGGTSRGSAQDPCRRICAVITQGPFRGFPWIFKIFFHKDRRRRMTAGTAQDLAICTRSCHKDMYEKGRDNHLHKSIGGCHQDRVVRDCVIEMHWDIAQEQCNERIYKENAAPNNHDNRLL